MRLFIIITFSIAGWFFSRANGQVVVTWSFTTTKFANNLYQIHFRPDVKPPWHIYSQLSPEGAGAPTKITFRKNPLVEIQGKTKELGKKVSKFEALYDITVIYFPEKVEFIQLVKLKSNVKTAILGTIEYMACTDEECLPPQTVGFNIPLK